MPTAGEARLKEKSVKKTSKDGISVKAKTSSSKSHLDAKRRVASCSISSKSSIPIPVKKGKENKDPNIVRTGKDAKKTTKVKKAPDFSKLHRKWEDQLAKGKAVSKKKNTTVEAFELTKNRHPSPTLQKPYAYNSEDEEDAVTNWDENFEIDSTALESILNETGIKDEHLGIAGRATIAVVSSSESDVRSQSAEEGILKRTSIYYTGPRAVSATREVSHPIRTAVTPGTQTFVSPLKPHNAETIKIQAAGSSVKKQVAWADRVPESDVVDFQPDFNALQSILSNTGISNCQARSQNTGRVTLAGGRLTPYRRTRQAFREEPTKRTSIYYTGPKRTRPSPRGPRIRQASLLASNQITDGAVTARTHKSHVGYNPFATLVGRQGIQEQDENDPIPGIATREPARMEVAPGSQSVNGNSLVTPGRKLDRSSQSSSAKEQPSWADIFTPHRTTILQKPVENPSRSLSSFGSFETPIQMQHSIESQIRTPLGIMANRPGNPVFVISSSKRPVTESNEQLKGTYLSSAKNLESNSSKSLNTQFTAINAPHTLQSSPEWQSQACPQALTPDLLSNHSRTQACNQLSIPLSEAERKEHFVPVNSCQRPPWSETLGPSRVSGVPQSNIIQSSSDLMPTTLFFNGLEVATPLAMHGSRVTCSTQQTPVCDSIVNPVSENAMQDRSSSVQLSTVQVTSFQPSTETKVTHSSSEASQQHKALAFPTEQRKSTPEKEGQDIALLERQALEDLGLLHISEGTHERSLHSNLDNAKDKEITVHLGSLKTCENNVSTSFAQPQRLDSRPLPAHDSTKLASAAPERQSCSYNIISSCHEPQSSFSPWCKSLALLQSESLDLQLA
ncbi:uncharacterized protein [Montipora foliosa]|uniref:uncharacterized protein n=1 Tax=Montipora foliosa TaxID=591990 RepID=UPI0035F21A9B